MNKLLFFGVAALLALFLLPADALASAGTGGNLPYEGYLESLRSSMTGPVAYTFSLVAIVVSCATLVFGGDLNGFARSLLLLVLVIGIIVGANAMMSGFFGKGALITAGVM